MVKPAQCDESIIMLAVEKNQNDLDNGCYSAWRRILPLLLLTSSTDKLPLNNGILFSDGSHISNISNVMIMSSSSGDARKADMVSD
jgi:hypothetical protein